MQHTVIIMYMGPLGLSIARSLGRFRIPVIGLDWNKNAIGFYSKYCSKSIVTPNPITQPRECLTYLLNFGKMINTKALLLPANDRYIFFISKFYNELSNSFIFNIPSPTLLKNIIDKKRQYELAGKFGIPIPKTLTPHNLDEMRDEYKNIKFPLFVKGRFSYDLLTKFQTKGFIVKTKEELEKVLIKIFKEKCLPVVQEFIKGPNKNHFKVCVYYSKNKELKCLFSTQKIRQFPVDFGIGTYMSSKYHEELINLALKFFNNIGYSGIGSIEFKLDEKDNKFKFIELNPRYWLQNVQATYAGINFPLANYMDCFGLEIEKQDTFENGIVWIDLIQDMKSFIYNRIRKDITLREWIRSLYNIDCHLYLATDDLMPVFLHFKRTLFHFMKKILRFKK